MIYIFKDTLNLAPISDTRNIENIRIGIYSISELIKKEFNEEIEILETNKKYEINKAIFINSRILPSKENINSIIDALGTSGAVNSIWDNDVLIASNMEYKEEYSYEGFEEKVRTDTEKLEWHGTYMKYPWDTITNLNPILEEHLDLRKNDLKKDKENVFIAKNTNIHNSVILDSSNGLICIEENTTIHPYTILKGPLWIGKNSVINSHSLIKNSSIGNNCKIGGEVSDSIFLDYSNKQHLGFIGSSFIGSWVNIGAGTSNSNLKNTYGEINVKYNNKTINTEETFLGCIIGDFSKTAINTSIYTGKIIGTNCHLFGNILENVENFTIYYKGIGKENIKCTLESAIITQERMFKRRNIIQNNKDKELLTNLYN